MTHGYIHIKIDAIMQDRGLSRTKLSQLALLQRKQLNKLINGEAARVDFDVLARLCAALECQIEDILEYNPPKKENVKTFG